MALKLKPGSLAFQCVYTRYSPYVRSHPKHHIFALCVSCTQHRKLSLMSVCRAPLPLCSALYHSARCHMYPSQSRFLMMCGRTEHFDQKLFLKVSICANAQGVSQFRRAIVCFKAPRLSYPAHLQLSKTDCPFSRYHFQNGRSGCAVAPCGRTLLFELPHFIF